MCIRSVSPPQQNFAPPLPPRGLLHSLISYVHAAEKHLSESAVPMRNEAGWFMKVAWNLALQCGESHREMAELFFACYKVYTCSPVPRPHPQRRKGSQTTPPKEERVPDQTPKRGTSSSSSLLPPALSPPGDRPGCAGEEEDVPADVCRCSSPRSQRHFQQPGQGERNTCLPLSLSPSPLSPSLSLSPSLPLSLSHTSSYFDISHFADIHSGEGAVARVRVPFHLPADWNPDKRP